MPSPSLSHCSPHAGDTRAFRCPMNENQSQTESLLDIVRSIKQETLLLPEFQRDFRWEMDQTYDLFDSLIREIFIGTIIYGKPGFGMTLRQMDDRPRKGKGSRGSLKMCLLSRICGCVWVRGDRPGCAGEP